MQTSSNTGTVVNVSYWDRMPPPEVLVTVTCHCGHPVTEMVRDGSEDSVRRLRSLEICKDCQAAKRKARAALRVECEATGKPCFLRFGGLPEGGWSWTSMDYRLEPGVSVYPGWRLPQGRYVLDLRGCCFSAIWLSDRPAYVVTGTLLNERGSDGEPLLAGATARRLPRNASLEWVI
jgi:hypothetical protein